MTTKRKQPTVPELLQLLENCRQVGGGTWNERVSALHEAAGARTQWNTPEEKELRTRIRRYLRDAGAAV